MDTVECSNGGKGACPRLLTLVIWILAIGATIAGFRYGLPPKEGPVTATIWWFPFAFLFYLVIPGREVVGLFLVLLQFPVIATMMTVALRKWSVDRVISLAIAAYLGAVAMCAVVVKFTGMGTR
jgi:hypothetical protein